MSDTIKFCKDCRWYEKRELAWCSHLTMVDVVEAQPEVQCIHARLGCTPDLCNLTARMIDARWGSCGKEAKLWEVKGA